ncbi:MAG: hypothetical protein U0792_17965 [Gemmataceae bacterium]
MTTLLAQLRELPQPTPEKFLGWNPGCFIQYFDDTPDRDGSKALSASSFDPEVAAKKQREQCAVCFSLQAFQGSRTREGFLSFRNLGVDIDLIPHTGAERIDEAGSDRRKNEYLIRHLFAFPLRPHWLIETRHGFHAVFRVLPVHEPQAVLDAQALNARLMRALRGDPQAMLLTQLLRVPGMQQFKEPDRPFLCRLLLDTSATISPYSLDHVRKVLDAWEGGHPSANGNSPRPEVGSSAGMNPSPWGRHLTGVPEGQRNTTAASVVGAILARLPESLWEHAGWGGLKEWNGRNPRPLPERELQLVYRSVARRERLKRRTRTSSLPVPRISR